MQNETTVLRPSFQNQQKLIASFFRFGHTESWLPSREIAAVCQTGRGS
jgi:hypothetical protein